MRDRKRLFRKVDKLQIKPRVPYTSSASSSSSSLATIPSHAITADVEIRMDSKSASGGGPDVTPPFSVFTSWEKWALIGVIGLAGFFRQDD
ncbi:hypothetical protein FRC04_009433 [Tulasnella sp. 424]|nr:hypothetical protein FRC04_009433 [Tulasnella sp. 424]KAG8971885.1 hypothetical protein FRC05_010554 [Tulasnella sp. 425]